MPETSHICFDCGRSYPTKTELLAHKRYVHRKVRRKRDRKPKENRDGQA